MTPEGYITLLAPFAVAAALRYGGLASVFLGQAGLETGFGLGSGKELFYEANNCFGMKSNLDAYFHSDHWDGNHVIRKTPEYYNGVRVTVDASFRKYKDISECFMDYAQFLHDAKSSGRYKYRDVLSITDPRAMITQISKRGYATDPEYITSVMRIINQYNLTQFDVGTRTMVTIGSARIDENGNTVGGQPGDNNGREVSTQPYYNHPKGWVVFRAKSVFVREELARAMESACANNNIGYSQPRNQSLYHAAKKVGFDLSKISTPCETDCARLVRCCILSTGINIQDFYTGDEAWVLSENNYFKSVTINSQEDLGRGDILVTKTKGHTAIVLTSGERYQLTTDEVQTCLRTLGFYTGAVDGVYGPGTRQAVITYQKGWQGALEVDGFIGPKTSRKLAETYSFHLKGLQNKKINFTKKQWMAELQRVADEAYRMDPEGSKHLNIYGDSHVFPPGWDFQFACDRLGARALYNLGITKQPGPLGSTHGFTVRDFWPELSKLGAIKITDPTKLQAGDIVIISAPDDPTFHAFYLASDYGPLISKWDFGRDGRIEHKQPTTAPLVEKAWSDLGRRFNYGIRLPYVSEKPEAKTLKQALVLKGQAESVKFTGHKIELDGVRGRETNQQMVRCLQHAANLDWGVGLKEDGDLGPLTKAAFSGHYIKYGETQWVVTAVEIIAYCKGLDPSGVEYPGHFGDGLARALGDKWLSNLEIFNLLK